MVAHILCFSSAEYSAFACVICAALSLQGTSTFYNSTLPPPPPPVITGFFIKLRWHTWALRIQLNAQSQREWLLLLLLCPSWVARRKVSPLSARCQWHQLHQLLQRQQQSQQQQQFVWLYFFIFFATARPLQRMCAGECNFFKIEIYNFRKNKEKRLKKERKKSKKKGGDLRWQLHWMRMSVCLS